MGEAPVLYSYWRSSCSWRVRIALQYAGIDVDQKAVHLVKDGGEQLMDEYSEKNPLQQVPTLLIHGLRLTQSMAIMEYIHDICPNGNLLPTDPKQRAKVRMVCEMINSGIQPIQNLAVLRKHSDEQAERAAWSHYWINKGFIALEKVLSETAGSRCVGDAVSLADCCLVPQVFNANRYSVDMSQFPIISRVNASLETLPEFKAAHPNQQPDCPE